MEMHESELAGNDVAESGQLLLVISIRQKEPDVSLSGVEGMALVEVSLVSNGARCRSRAEIHLQPGVQIGRLGC